MNAKIPLSFQLDLYNLPVELCEMFTITMRFFHPQNLFSIIIIIIIPHIFEFLLGNQN